MSCQKPPLGVCPYYVNISIRVREICEAMIRQTDVDGSHKWNHNAIRMWCQELMMLNEMDRTLRDQEEQKVWVENKRGDLRELL